MLRTLPSLTSLLAFEAAARHSSFTRAGEELSLTQSAISRQVGHLEEFLGIRLFERVRRRVILTKAGKAYAKNVQSALKQVEAATIEALVSKEEQTSLHIASLATFATHWLLPRLGSFVEAHPDISLQVSSYHHGTFADVENDVDVAIHYGGASWPNGLVEKLIPEELITLCTAEYAEKVGLNTFEDIRKATLLQQTTRPDAWAKLLKEMGQQHVNSLRGPRFELYSMILEAAVAGLGVGAVPRFVAERYIENTRLISPFDVSVLNKDVYYLAFPEAKRQSPSVQAFRRWIQREVRREARAQREISSRKVKKAP
jgi:LysR family glycine cleavage system transcriptional activator